MRNEADDLQVITDVLTNHPRTMCPRTNVPCTRRPIKYHLRAFHPRDVPRVSTEVTFWHSAEYGSDFRLNSGEIPRNSAEFRGISPEFSRNHFRSQKIPRNSVLAEFRGHPRRAVQESYHTTNPYKKDGDTLSRHQLFCCFQ